MPNVPLDNPSSADIPAADIAVIGAGPTGATVARLLAEWGFDVVLMPGPRRTTPRLAESLPPSTRSLLVTLNLLDRVDRAGFLRATGNTVWWGEGEPRIERFASRDASGWQVPRGAFDQLLFDFASESGVRVLHETTVRDVDLGDGDVVGDASRRDVYAADRAVVRGSRPGGEPVEIKACMVIDCSGRTGVIARRGLRRDEPGHQTVALAAAWRARQGWSLPDETHTLVEAFDDGWAWSIPVSRSVRYFTVMVDRGAWRGGARGYDTAIAKTTHLRALAEQGELDGAPWGAEASLYAAERFSGPRFLLAGDAAATLDPLSSFGVKKALASGWLAAIVANTCLRKPSMADAARALFDAREREVYEAGLAGAVAFARDAVTTFPGAFWSTRAATNLAGRATGAIEDRVRADADVRAAFERLRASDRAMLRACDDVRVEPRPMIEGREVIMADALVLRAAPEGVRFLANINLPALLAIVRQTSNAAVPQVFESYRRVDPAAHLASFLIALAVLLSSDAVEIVAA